MDMAIALEPGPGRKNPPDPRRMIQVGKKKGNLPLDDAIMEHLRHARISPEEAYDKGIDKKKVPALPEGTADGWL